jgi:hypothetical protein
VVSRPESLILRFTPAAGASALVALVVATRPLGAVTRSIALACVVASWVGAVAFQRRSVRAHATVVAAIAAAVAAGQVEAGLPYGIAATLLVLGCLVSMRAARAASAVGQDDPFQLPVRASIVLAASATAITAGLIISLPKLAERIERRINAMFGGDGEEATAFSTTMVLGSTRGMLLSDTIVMRIEGERPEYLRGAVYDKYDPPFWVTTGPGRRRHGISAPQSPEAEAGTTRITLVRGAPNGEDMRWFLPAGACDLGLGAGRVEIDAFGVARRARAEEPALITYRTKGCMLPSAGIAPPSPTDLDVPIRVRRALAPIAAGWTLSATNEHEKLSAIKRELSRFEYSLEVPRTMDLDPIVDFVTVHRAGHCEMFASAMALMARLEGIPARVIGGYRVSEVNPVTDRAVVRDRNAHAWVEVWVDGGWRAIDPTPESEAFAPHAGFFDHAGDVLSTGLERVVMALSKLGLMGTAGVLGAIIAVLFGLRWIDGRLQARRTRRAGGRALSPPLPCFDALTRALARSGFGREESEPIESFAKRLQKLEENWAQEAADALLDYARLRYGGIGEEAEVVRQLDRVTRAITSQNVSRAPT